jgi:hypothetical protein
VIEHALNDGTGVLSTQVLQEYYVNATRKLRLDAAKARARIDVARSGKYGRSRSGNSGRLKK